MAHSRTAHCSHKQAAGEIKRGYITVTVVDGLREVTRLVQLHLAEFCHVGSKQS